MRKPLPDEEIARRYLAGESVFTLAIEFDVNEKTITARLRARNVALRGSTGRPPTLTGDRLNRALAAYEHADGLTIPEVAAQFGIGERALHRYAAKAGIARTARGLVGKNSATVQEITTVEQLRHGDCGDE